MMISGVVLPIKGRNENLTQWNLNKKPLHLQKKTVTTLPQDDLELLSRVREWRQNKDAIVELCAKPKGSKKEKLEGGGRKPMDEGMEEELFEWIQGRRSRGLRVSRTLIMRKAKYIYDERCDASERDLFVASRGWLEKFMRQNRLSLRRRTTVAQHDPARVIDKLISYVLHVRRLTSKHKYLASNIIAMDETAVWADMVANTTVDGIGTRSVSLSLTPG